MRNRGRLDKAERELAALAKRLAPPPGSYFASWMALSYEELEAERVKLQKERDEALARLEGPIPPVKVEKYHKGFEFDQAELLCIVFEDVWAKRLNKDLGQNRLLYDATLGEEERRRLDEEYKALVSMVGPQDKRIADWNKWLEARENGTAVRPADHAKTRESGS